MFYLIWIPLVIIYYIISAILTKDLNNQNSWKCFFMLAFLGALGPWPLVAKYSKNLIFDGLLYDVMIFASFYLTLIYLGTGKAFNVYQWVACGMIVGGMIIMKLSG